MHNYIFSSRHRTILIAFMALGLLCLGISFFAGDDGLHTRFWSNVLLNSVFFTGLALMAFFLYCAHHIGYSGWHTVFKRVWESLFYFLPFGIGIMIILGLGSYFGFHHLYHWADAHSLETDAILEGKSGFLNPTFYVLATLIIGGLWVFLARKLRNLSLLEDINGTINFNIHKRMRVYAAIALPLIGFGSAALIWLWVMSVDAHWYSTLFAWYTAASLTVAVCCLTVLIIYWAKAISEDYFPNVSKDHIHDLGKYIFAFSIFWTYLWFSQYMLIWYGNVGEETIYFRLRHDEYPVLFFGNLLINFVLPFFVLLRNDTKRKQGTMVFIAIAVFLGHWMDVFLMIKPGTLHTAHALSEHAGGHGEHAAEAGAHASNFVAGFTLPGLLELGTMLGFFGLFMFIVLGALSGASLMPAKDPYLEESLHHHV